MLFVPLYDLQSDPDESKNIIAKHPDLLASLRAAYDQWWQDVQPLLVNEDVTDVPKTNPLKELYWKQFGGGPDEDMLREMDPTKGTGGENKASPTQRKKRKKRREDKAKASNE